jgi:hypothetical protein
MNVSVSGEKKKSFIGPPASVKRSVILFFAGLLFSLVLAEAVMRVGDFDWRYVIKTLYYAGYGCQSASPGHGPGSAL